MEFKLARGFLAALVCPTGARHRVGRGRGGVSHTLHPTPETGSGPEWPSRGDPGESGQERGHKPTSGRVKRGLRTTETILAEGNYPGRTKMFVDLLIFRAKIFETALMPMTGDS